MAQAVGPPKAAAQSVPSILALLKRRSIDKKPGHTENKNILEVILLAVERRASPALQALLRTRHVAQRKSSNGLQLELLTKQLELFTKPAKWLECMIRQIQPLVLALLGCASRRTW